MVTRRHSQNAVTNHSGWVLAKNEVNIGFMKEVYVKGINVDKEYSSLEELYNIFINDGIEPKVETLTITGTLPPEAPGDSNLGMIAASAVLKKEGNEILFTNIESHLTRFKDIQFIIKRVERMHDYMYGHHNYVTRGLGVYTYADHRERVEENELAMMERFLGTLERGGK